MLEEDKSQFAGSKTFPLSAAKCVLDSESPVVSQGPTGPAALTRILFVPIFSCFFLPNSPTVSHGPLHLDRMSLRLQASRAAVSSGGIRCSQQLPCCQLWSPAWREWIYDSVFGNYSEILMRKARSECTGLLFPCVRLLSSSWCCDNIH